MMKKNAQGLSLNTVVIASIVLIVLVVLIGIFTGHIGNWIGGIGDATKKTCPTDQKKSECDLELETQVFGDFGDDLEEGQVCCRPRTNCEEIGGSCLWSTASTCTEGQRLTQGDDWCEANTLWKYCCKS